MSPREQLRKAYLDAFHAAPHSKDDAGMEAALVLFEKLEKRKPKQGELDAILTAKTDEEAKSNLAAIMAAGTIFSLLN